MPHPIELPDEVRSRGFDAPSSAECRSCEPAPCRDSVCPWNAQLWGLDPVQRLGRLLGWLAFVEARLRDTHGRRFVAALMGWGDRIAAAKRSYDRAWWAAHVAEGAVAAAEAEIESLGAELGAALEPRQRRPVDELYEAVAEAPALQIDDPEVLEVLAMAVDGLQHEEVPAFHALSGRYAAACSDAHAAVVGANAAREQLRQAMSSVLATYDAAHALCHDLELALGRYADEHGLGPDWARQRLEP